MKAVIVVFALALAGCNASLGSPASGNASPSAARSPSAASSPSAAPSVDASKVPPGRIRLHARRPGRGRAVFQRHFNGRNEHVLFETKGCACIRWSADGSQIWTVTETDTALAFTTQDPDGGNRVVHVPDIPTLSLAPGFGSADGRHVAFFGWDDTDATRAGVWTANTDLTGLHHVTPVPDGVLGIDPIGMSANGSHIYFHGDLGANTDNDFRHAGNVYVIAADGSDMRQLNPEGTKTGVDRNRTLGRRSSVRVHRMARRTRRGRQRAVHRRWRRWRACSSHRFR